MPVAARHDRAPAGVADAVLRHVLLHPGAKVVNAWRDGLIAATRPGGTTLTKNEARARIGLLARDGALRAAIGSAAREAVVTMLQRQRERARRFYLEANADA